MSYALQLINDHRGDRREWRVTGEMYEYILNLIQETEGLRGIFEVQPGEH